MPALRAFATVAATLPTGPVPSPRLSANHDSELDAILIPAASIALSAAATPARSPMQ